MKLAYFNDFRLGVLKGDRLVDVTTVVAQIPHTGPGDLMNGLIANFGQFRARILVLKVDIANMHLYTLL